MEKIEFSGRITRCFRSAVLVNDYVRVPLSLLPSNLSQIGASVGGIAERNSSAEQYVATEVEKNINTASTIESRSVTPPNVSVTPVEPPAELYDTILSDADGDDNKDTAQKKKLLLRKLLNNGVEDNTVENDQHEPATSSIAQDVVVEPSQIDFGTFPLHEQRRLILRITNKSNCLMHTLRCAKLRSDSRVHKLLISLTSPSRDAGACGKKDAASETCAVLEKWLSSSVQHNHHQRKLPAAAHITAADDSPEKLELLRNWNMTLSESDSCYIAVIIDGEYVGELKDASLQLVFDSGGRDERIKIPIYACVDLPKKKQMLPAVLAAAAAQRSKTFDSVLPRRTPFIKICLSPKNDNKTCAFFGRDKPVSPLSVVPRSFAFREVDKDIRVKELECVLLADETDRISTYRKNETQTAAKKIGVAGWDRPREPDAKAEEAEFGRLSVLPTQRMKLKIQSNILACIKDPSNWRSHLPVLDEALCAENYKERFQILLALEMAHKDMLWQNLLVNDVHFTKQPLAGKLVGNRPRYSFNAPVLYTTSFNPVGDMQRRDESVFIYARRATHHHHAAIVFEGFVDRVEGSVVHGLFDDNFHPQPHDTYTVTFRMRHETLHRMFTAVCYAQNFMKQAFEKILFVAGESTEPAMMPPQCMPGQVKWFNAKLNAEQRLAVKRICAGQLRPRPMLIYGPPGTGKTMTLVEAALQVSVNVAECKILLCAPSNAAANLLVELLEKFLLLNAPEIDTKTVKILRLLSNSNGASSKLANTAVLKMKNLKHMLDLIEKSQICIATCSAMGWFFQLDESRRIFSHVFVDEAASAVEAECLIPMLMLKMPSFGLPNQRSKKDDIYMRNTDRSTCFGLENSTRREDARVDKENITFLMPQIVLAGDPKQLGAVVHSEDALAFAELHKISDPLQQSLMERLMKLPAYATSGKWSSHSIVMLKNNYRSSPSIVKLVSEMFYDDSLVSAVGENISVALADELNFSREYSRAVTMVTHEKPHAKEANWASLSNMTEVQTACEITERLMSNFGVAPEKIGIITTYRSQANAIQLALKLKFKKQSNFEKLPMIGTVQEFQGQERDVIVLSTVRSQTQSSIERNFQALFGVEKKKCAENEKTCSQPVEYADEYGVARLSDAEFDARWIEMLKQLKIHKPDFEKNMLGFVADSRRFNVAITRARKKLMVLGNPYTLAMSPFWYRFMLLIEKQQKNGEEGEVGGAAFHGEYRMSDVRSFVRYLYADVLKSGKVLEGENG